METSTCINTVSLCTVWNVNGTLGVSELHKLIAVVIIGATFSVGLRQKTNHFGEQV